MHVGPWLERLADTSGEPRDRLLAALDDARARRRRPSSRRSPARRRSSRPGSWPRRWRSSRRAGAPTDRADRSCRSGCRAARRPATRRAAGPTTARPSAGSGASSRPSVAATPERPGERGRDPDRRSRGHGPARLGASRRRSTSRGPRRPRRGARPGDPGALGRRPRDRPSRRGRRRAGSRRAPADLRRLPGARGHPRPPSRSAWPGLRACRSGSRSRSRCPGRPTGSQAGGRRALRRRRRSRRRPTPEAVQCPWCASTRRDGQRLRADPVPLAALLPRLPPAVRGPQAGLRLRRARHAGASRLPIGASIGIDARLATTRSWRTRKSTCGRPDPASMCESPIKIARSEREQRGSHGRWSPSSRAATMARGDAQLAIEAGRPGAAPRRGCRGSI